MRWMQGTHRRQQARRLAARNERQPLDWSVCKKPPQQRKKARVKRPSGCQLCTLQIPPSSNDVCVANGGAVYPAGGIGGAAAAAVGGWEDPGAPGAAGGATKYRHVISSSCEIVTGQP